jgi:UDP-N-acetylmuramyl pentapeptide phosphotransferase/UDP-N-acetylglucosamine-1-phosphate transferase
LIVHTAASIPVGVLWLHGAHGFVPATMLCLCWMFVTVSSINLVNFMDGINGLVASQIGISAASLALFGWEAGRTSWIAVTVAAGCAGFLPWNFPRARIFLGDVGSGSLGFLVPALATLAVRDQGLRITQVLLPLAPLYADAIVTILRRWKRSERLTEPHRSHIYQRLANHGYGHTRVTLMYAVASALGGAAAHAQAGVSSNWPIPVLYIAMLVVAGFAVERRLIPATEPGERALEL